MRALIKSREDIGFELSPGHDHEIDDPVDDEVQIKVSTVSICGSDINIWKWNEAAQKVLNDSHGVGFVAGHEAVGVVVKTGPNAILNVGDRIAVENHFYCGNCVMCDEDRGDICMKMYQFGYGNGTKHGGCSQFSNLRSKFCYKLTSHISDEQACLIEPMGVAHNVLERIGVQGKELLVIGCGPVGLLTCSVGKALGASRVIAVDVKSECLDLAVKMGADITVNPTQVSLGDEIMKLTNQNGVQRIVEASGHAPTLSQCLKWLRKGGKLGIVGIPKGEVKFENPLPDLVFKSLEIHTVHGRRIFQSWQACEDLIASGKVKPELTISHRYGMTNFEEAYGTLLAGKACKIILDPQS